MGTIKGNFSTIVDSFSRDFEKIFHKCYPCNRDSDETLQEANLTTNLLRALLNSDSNLFTWDEFPIPADTKINPKSKTKNRIDSVVIDSNGKTITMIESKCLKRSERKQTIPCLSIAKDIARMINVADRYDVFPDRIWKNDGLKEKPIPIGNDYNEYSVFGIAACGVWWTGKKQTPQTIKTFFGRGVKKAFGDMYAQKPDLQNRIDDEQTEVREIRLPEIPLKGKKWQYFVILYTFRISKKPIEYPQKTIQSPIDEDLIAELRRHSIKAEECGTWWYLYPSSFVGTYIVGGRRCNKLWINKSGDTCKLLAYSREKKRTIDLPDGFVPDINEDFVSLRISPDSKVDDLKRIFAEIVRLNP